MGKLLCANFSRLGKSKIFYLTPIALFVFFLVGCLYETSMVQGLLDQGYERSIDQNFFYLMPHLGVFQAVFISFFLGTEYSDGTIRNKLIAGHRRSHIYISNYLTCLAVSCLFLVLGWIAWIPLIQTVGPLEMGLSGFLLYALAALGFTAVYAAVFTLVASLTPNKALTVILTLILWLGMIVAGSGLIDRLNEPEFSGGMAYIDGEFVEVPSTPNPLYLTGTVRTVCEFFRDLLPSSQAILMSNAEIIEPGRCFFFSTVLTAVLTFLGTAAFRRKDIQ